jgi:hypothetical protein
MKGLWRVQPFNRLATASVREAFRQAGVRSEGVVRHLHRIGRVTTPLPDGRRLELWSNADDWLTNQVYWRGWDGYEPKSTRLFYHLAHRAGVVLDGDTPSGAFARVRWHAPIPEGDLTPPVEST